MVVLREKKEAKEGLARCWGLEGLPFAFGYESVLVLRLSGVGRLAAGSGEVIGV